MKILTIYLPFTLFLAMPQTALAQIRICQTADSLYFGNQSVGTQASKNVLVSNCGVGALTLNDVGPISTSPHFILAGTCSSGLALTANQSCSLLLTYQPKSAGNHNIAIKLYNNSPTPSQFLTAYGTGTAINQINVTEFYHAGLDHYFISADAPEISAIEQGAAGPGWVKTGQVFAASAVPASNLAPVCRFYGNPGLGPNSHFYTAQAEECALLKSQYQPTEKSWRYEQTAFYISVNTQAAACPGTAQIRRFYNRGFPAKDSNHRYVNSAALAANMLSRGWVDEGVVFCAQP